MNEGYDVQILLFLLLLLCFAWLRIHFFFVVFQREQQILWTSHVRSRRLGVLCAGCVLHCDEQASGIYVR